MCTLEHETNCSYILTDNDVSDVFYCKHCCDKQQKLTRFEKNENLLELVNTKEYGTAEIRCPECDFRIYFKHWHSKRSSAEGIPTIDWRVYSLKEAKRSLLKQRESAETKAEKLSVTIHKCQRALRNMPV